MSKSEKVAVSDLLGIVLIKADGKIITNEPVIITKDLLKKIAREQNKKN